MEVLRKNRENIINSLFYIGLFIELLIVIVDKSAYINPIEGRLFQITFLLFGLKVLFTKYSYKEWALIFFMGIVGVLSYFATDRNEVLRVVMFVATSKNISQRKACKLSFYTILVGVTGLILLSMMGILGTVAITQDYGRGMIETRYCLGIGHPNALHCMVWLSVLLGIYLYMNYMKWYVFLILFAGNIGLYCLTGSKTGILITMFTILSAVLLKYWKVLKESKWTYIVGTVIFVLVLAFALGTSIRGDTQGPFAWLDQYLTGRIRHSFIKGGMFDWSLFSVPEHTLYFDMGFMRLFYWYGYIPGVLYLVANGLLMWNAYKEKNPLTMLVVVALTIYTVVEAHAISVYIGRNYVLLLLVGTWSTVFYTVGKKELYVWQLIPGLNRKSSQGA